MQEKEVIIINKNRVKKLNENQIKNGDYILYWMQTAQRIEFNHALNYAIHKANDYNKPLIVFFGLTDKFPEANKRHYSFMLEGLIEVKKKLKEKNIKMVIQNISPDKGIINLSENAKLIVTDRGYLRIERKWRQKVANSVNCPLIQIETNIIVPVEQASEKEEYAAYTIRKKINKLIGKYTNFPEFPEIDFPCGKKYNFKEIETNSIDEIINNLNIEANEKVNKFQGGTSEAKKHLRTFIKNKLDKYSDLSNDPSRDKLSNISPYLHFGQISPLYVFFEINKTDSPSKEDFLEQLIIRRELSINFVYYNTKYDFSLADILPDWAYKTLKKHEKDFREYIYDLKDLEDNNTHDSYWNAAQKEMVLTGKMHGYMRMYWGKKIIEWSKTPQNAFKKALYLNNKYNLDGRDPNAFSGIAWCFGKHDRAWAEREIFGKVRYMSANGLERKFNIEQYVKTISKLD